MCIYDFTVECLRLRDEEEGTRLRMEGSRVLFFFSAFEKSGCTICFSKNDFFCFFKIVAMMEGRRRQIDEFSGTKFPIVFKIYLKN